MEAHKWFDPSVGLFRGLILYPGSSRYSPMKVEWFDWSAVERDESMSAWLKMLTDSLEKN